MSCSSECCVLSPGLGRIRILRMGLWVSRELAVSTTRSLEQFCLSLGLGRLGLATLCRNHSPLSRNSGCRSILRAQPQHQSPGEMRCRDVSEAAPGALVHVGGEAAALAGLWVFTMAVLSLLGGSQVPGKQVACGFWQEIPPGLCQMHFGMKVPPCSVYY